LGRQPNLDFRRRGGAESGALDVAGRPAPEIPLERAKGRLEISLPQRETSLFRTKQAYVESM